jgi:hypothetical protein
LSRLQFSWIQLEGIVQGAMSTGQDQIGAVFDRREDAEAAVAELRQLGLADEHLGACVLEPDSYVFEEDPGTKTRKAVEKGVAVGAPVGAVAGMTVLALAVPGLGTLGVAGILASGATGTLAGTWLGTFFGLNAGQSLTDEEADWEHVALKPGQLLIVTGGHDHPDEVSGILSRNGGHLIPKPDHSG